MKSISICCSIPIIQVLLQDADKKGLSTIAEEVKHLAEKAKDNSLKPEDYEVGAKSVLFCV